MNNTNACWESLRRTHEQDPKARCINTDCEYCFRTANSGCGILDMEINRTATENGDAVQGTFNTPDGKRIRPDGLSGSQIAKLVEQSTASVNIRTNKALDRMITKMAAHGMTWDDVMSIMGMGDAPVNGPKNHQDAIERIAAAKIAAEKSDKHGNCGKAMSAEAKRKQRKAKGQPFTVTWPDGRVKHYYSTVHASEDEEIGIGSRSVYGYLKGTQTPGNTKRSAHLKGCKFEYLGDQ